MPTDRVHRPHQQAQPRIRTPPHGQALHHWACVHVVEGLFMRLWPRPLIVAGIGVVSQGPEEGQTAVPVGGGRAWPDNEPTRRANHQRPSPTGVEGAGGTGGPECGARGRRRGLARQHTGTPTDGRPPRSLRGLAGQHTNDKPQPIGGRREACGARPRCRWVAAGPGRASRSTTPSRRLACGDLTGGRARRRPEHQRSRKQQAQSQIPAAPLVWRAPVGPDGAAVVRRHGCAWPKGAWVRVRARVCATWALPAPLRPPTRRENQCPFGPKWRSGALSGVAVR